NRASDARESAVRAGCAGRAERSPAAAAAGISNQADAGARIIVQGERPPGSLQRWGFGRDLGRAWYRPDAGSRHASGQVRWRAARRRREAAGEIAFPTGNFQVTPHNIPGRSTGLHGSSICPLLLVSPAAVML